MVPLLIRLSTIKLFDTLDVHVCLIVRFIDDGEFVEIKFELHGR